MLFISISLICRSDFVWGNFKSLFLITKIHTTKYIAIWDFTFPNNRLDNHLVIMLHLIIISLSLKVVCLLNHWGCIYLFYQRYLLRNSHLVNSS